MIADDLRALAGTGQRFGVVLADPPWAFATWNGKPSGRDPSWRPMKNAAARHYETMSLAEIMALPVRDVLARDAAVLIWVPSSHLPQALQVLEAWGAVYKSLGLVWVKQNRSGAGLHLGMGYWFRQGCEVAVFGTVGKPKRFDRGVRQVILSPRREHSRKPDETFDRIERLLGDVPRLELFGRQSRPGWTVLGDQVDRFDQEPIYQSLHDLARVRLYSPTPVVREESSIGVG
jgi:N6-adenosine-specific RNA methylase IME4